MGRKWHWPRVPKASCRAIYGEIIHGPLTKGVLVTLQVTPVVVPITLAIV